MQNTVFKALAHPLRRELLSVLRKQPRYAGDLAQMFEVTWPTVSRHLSVLKEADLVVTVREKNQILYSLNTSVVEDVAAMLLTLTDKTVADKTSVTPQKTKSGGKIA